MEDRAGSVAQSHLFELIDEAEAEDIDVVVRWRACVGNMEKSPINSAYDSGYRKLLSLTAYALWKWVDETIKEHSAIYSVRFSSLMAVVYEEKRTHKERMIKAIKRNDHSTFNGVTELA